MNFFKKNLKALLFTGIILLLIQFVVCSVGAQQDKGTIKIGSSSPGSTAYIHFEACSYLINEHSDKYRVSSMSTSGSSENIILLDEGKIDLGSASSTDYYAAWSGERWEKEIPIWQVCTYTYWPQALVALAESEEIQTINDLVGKQVSIGAVGSGAEYLWRLVLEEYGIYDDLKLNNLGWTESFEALADGLVVATPGNFPGGKLHPEMVRLDTRKPFKVLDIDPDILNSVREYNPGILSTILPKDAYEGIEEDITCAGFTGLVISTAHTDDDKIYEFCKMIYENIEELHEMSTVSDYSALETAIEGFLPDYPIHPGAARYFQEKGIWNDNLIIGER